MLDYIMSKMVLLIFLLLLVSAFGLVKQTLDSYFLQQSARNLAKTIARNIEHTVTTIRSTEEVKVYPLPTFLEGGGAKLAYDVNIIAFKEGGDCYLGIIIMTQDHRRVLAFDRAAIGSKAKITVCYNYGDVFARGTATENTYIVVERKIELDGTVELKVCGQGSAKPKCVECKDPIVETCMP